jgi:kinesin family protein C1
VVHDVEGNTTVSELTYVDVSHPERFDSLMSKAMSHRSVGATALNERSSRSHCVFTLRIEGHCEATGDGAKGVLNLIDLAGSERLSKSLAQGDRLKVRPQCRLSLGETEG